MMTFAASQIRFLVLWTSVLATPLRGATDSEPLSPKTISEINKRIAEMPDIVPLSEDAERSLEKTLSSKREKKESKDKHSVSTDCKQWSSAIADETFDNQTVYLKASDGKITAFNERQRIFVIAGESPMIHQVADNAFWGITGERGFFYRPLKPGRVSKGIMGMLESLLLIAAELKSGDTWSISKTKDDTLVLISTISNLFPKRKNYFIITCQATGCKLYPSSGEEPIDLKSDKEAWDALKKKGLFSEAQRTLLAETCKRLSSDAFRDQTAQVLGDYKKSCGSDLSPHILSASKISALCVEMKDKILPMFKKL